MKKNLNVPYFSQLDNKYVPGGTCNVTSVAMCLAFFGIVGDGSERQLEDQLTQKCWAEQWDRHSPYDLAKLFAWKKIPHRFTERATFAEVKKHLDNGKPCIFHGWFTRSGHIVAVRGYDDSAYGGKGAFVLNDPAGEWHNWGYSGSGEGVRYSYELINRLCCPDGNLWCHFVG